MTVVSGGETLEVRMDSINEQVNLGAALVSVSARKKLIRAFPTADFFLTPEHAIGWQFVLEMDRRNLEWDPATAKRLAPDVDVELLTEIIDARPEVPPNLEYHIIEQLWDRTRATVLQGPVNSLIEALRDPKCDREKVESLARQVAATLKGGEARYLRDPKKLVHEAMTAIDRRYAGEAVYPFGIDGFDWFDSIDAAKEAGVKVDDDEERVRRILPGAAPKQITLISAMTGAGKTTTIGSIVLGLARQKRRVMVASWEVGSVLSLEFLTELSLVESDPRFSRTRVMKGRGNWEEMRDVFRKRAMQISKYVRFMDNPFYRRTTGGKRRDSNEEHIDIFSSAISEFGADVAIADLWSRMLVRKNPEDEELALFRQQSHFQELNCHGIIVTQQKHKELMQRADKRPTPDLIKGSGAYEEIANLSFGLHRPGLYKSVDDDRLEIFGWKQKDYVSRWALSLGFDTSTGVISGGRSIPYDPGFTEEDGFGGDSFLGGGKRKKKKP